MKILAIESILHSGVEFVSSLLYFHKLRDQVIFWRNKLRKQLF